VIFWRRAYRIIALLAIAPLVACTDAEIFDRVAGPQSAANAKAAWPRLEAVPATPPLGVYTDALPDPAKGEAVQIELSVAAENAEIRRKSVEGPVE
jgi:hypothetical protein